MVTFKEWSESETLNSEYTLRRYFLVLENPTWTFLSYGSQDEFPNNGFFVDERSELQ